MAILQTSKELSYEDGAEGLANREITKVYQASCRPQDQWKILDWARGSTIVPQEIRHKIQNLNPLPQPRMKAGGMKKCMQLLYMTKNWNLPRAEVT